MTTKQLNRVTVRVSGGVTASSVRFPRAHQLVQDGRAEWVNHPISDAGKVPTVRIVTTAATMAAAACEYDRLKRRMGRNELKRIPFVGNIDLLLQARP